MDIYEEIVRLRQEGRACALATIINTEGSIPSFATAKMLVRDDGSIAGTIGGGAAEGEVMAAALEVMAQEKPRIVSFNLNAKPGLDSGMVCGGNLEVYVEPIVPVPALYIFGAGHTGLETYKTARQAGFEVTVIDDRAEFANRERYPAAVDVIAQDLETALPRLSPSANAYIFIVTRSHTLDTQVLRWALDTRARYIGMIGSKRKVTGIYHVLQKEGFAPEKFDRVQAPVGLDIGAQTPEEIAISVVAEMIATRRRCQAALPHLRCLGGAVHEPQLREVG
jgi:xanthine dehydrogenase accessory factor